jgi:hypothetical protein
MYPRTDRKLKGLMAAVIVVLAFAGLPEVPSMASAHGLYAHYYLRAHTLDDRLKSKGIVYRSGHVTVDTAACLGLPLYGARMSGSHQTFWRFRCEINSTDGHLFDSRVSTTTGPQRGRWYWHLLSVKKLY